MPHLHRRTAAPPHLRTSTSAARLVPSPSPNQDVRRPMHDAPHLHLIAAAPLHRRTSAPPHLHLRTPAGCAPGRSDRVSRGATGTLAAPRAAAARTLTP
eukprot:scaffold3651_cov61-Phaeocystis_antarctica.AAC.1